MDQAALESLAVFTGRLAKNQLSAPAAKEREATAKDYLDPNSVYVANVRDHYLSADEATEKGYASFTSFHCRVIARMLRERSRPALIRSPMPRAVDEFLKSPDSNVSYERDETTGQFKLVTAKKVTGVLYSPPIEFFFPQFFLSPYSIPDSNDDEASSSEPQRSFSGYNTACMNCLSTTDEQYKCKKCAIEYCSSACMAADSARHLREDCATIKAGKIGPVITFLKSLRRNDGDDSDFMSDVWINKTCFIAKLFVLKRMCEDRTRLESVFYLIDNMEKAVPSYASWVILIGALVYEHLLTDAAKAAVSVNEVIRANFCFYMNSFELITATGTRVGAGVTLAGSLPNHTCNATIGVSTVVSRGHPPRLDIGTRDVLEPGQEVMISYTGPPVGHLKRRAKLEYDYCFSCRCQKCTTLPNVNNWGKKQPRKLVATESTTFESDEEWATLVVLSLFNEKLIGQTRGVHRFSMPLTKLSSRFPMTRSAPEAEKIIMIDMKKHKTVLRNILVEAWSQGWKMTLDGTTMTMTLAAPEEGEAPDFVETLLDALATPAPAPDRLS